MRDEEGDIEASVFSGYGRSREREMSAMVSALTHVVAGENDRQGLFMTPEPPPYIGVRQRDGGEWVAEIPLRWNLSCISTFDTPEVAAMARDREPFESRGDEARLNFPQLSLNINGAEPTAAPSMQIPPPHPPLPQLENLDRDSGLGWSEEATGSDEVETVGVAEARLNSECLGKGKRKIKSPGGGRGNKKTSGVRIGIPFEDIFQTKEMTLKDAAANLNVGRSTLRRACREYGIHRWPPHKLTSQSCRCEPPAVVDQVRIPNLNTEILLPSHEVEIVEIESEGTGEGETEESHLNSECLVKGKRKVKTPGGERGNKKTCGVRIGISLEDILQTKGMSLNDAAMNLNVSRSTLKRACREHDIHRWPPRGKNKLLSQSCPNKSPTVVDQEETPKLNYDTLPSDQALAATIDTNSVSVKARYMNDITIKFWLSRPCGIAELEQQVKKRLKLEAGTYYIKYKEEDNELILMACDEDLKYCISGSKPLGTNSIEVFLVPK